MHFLFAAIALCSVTLAAEPPKPRERPTDDVLLQSLDAHAGDDYDRALLGEPEKPKTDPKDRGRDELEKELKQQLGPATAREDQQEDHLLQAAKGMAEVRNRLVQGKSDAVTQTVQRQVVADLQKIIDDAKKSGKCCGQPLACSCKPCGKCSGGGKPPGVASPAVTQGPAKESNPNATRENNAPSAEKKKLERKTLMEQYRIALPEREREKMSASPSEYFLPEYEREIEDYFRRLSSGMATPEGKDGIEN